ncbi:hypothetical protein [Nocardia sp. CC227C]|uniref:hypothetical protein n=1 Tax=Nocardia sp. CC227C TaxID=3044562 RepID=UPI00278C8823|nr:hypothetical protein [Nocardia sp. CC227C]
MEITLLDDAHPGEPVSVHSQSGDWTAIWRGGSIEHRGRKFQVEVDIEDVDTWSTRDAESEFIGIKTTGGRTIVCGLVSVAYDDGTVALDLKPGVVLIDQDFASNVRTGQRICLACRVMEVYPTGA